jgi:hypothetical protein
VAKQELKISITEMTIVSGKTQQIRIWVNGQPVNITVSAEVKAYFNEQFVRANPSAIQKRRFITLSNVAAAAYLKGYKDGQARNTK